MNAESATVRRDLLSELGLQEEDQLETSGRLALMLSIEDNFGQQWAFAYAQLMLIRFNIDQSRELELYFPGHRVTVTGVCLDGLYRDVCRHRTERIVEDDNAKLRTASPNELVVQHIAIEEWR